MRRIRYLLASAFAAALVAAAASPPDDAEAARTPPNVVVIMTDDQTVEQMRVLTQVNEFFAAKGTTFDNFIASYPLCCPSRATFLTGQYALHHGVLGNEGPHGGYKALDHTNTLPVWLEAAGYRTSHVGKYLNGYPGDEIPPGWTDWQAVSPPAYYDYQLNDNGTIVYYGTAPEDYQTDVVADRAIETITESIELGGPFFTYIAPFAPHSDGGAPPVPAPRHAGTFSSEPLPPSPAFNEADVSDKPAYIQATPLITAAEAEEITADYQGGLESLLAIDELFGRVIDTLEAGGVLENTVVIFESDNGRMRGEHRQQADKKIPYEESIHVPMLIAGRGFPAGKHISEQTANIDIAATIVGLTRATPGLVMDGIDLRSVVRDPAAFDDRAVLIERYDGDCYEGVRTPTFMYARYDTGEEELYDLVADPAELTSRHADPAYAEVKADLAARTDAITGPDVPPCEVKPLTVSVGDATATEATKGTVSVSVPVTFSKKATGPVTVAYALNAGSASTADFVQKTGTVKLARGHTVSSIPVSISADSVSEADETLEVTITSVTPAFTIERGSGTVTIHDGAPSTPPSLSIGDIRTMEGDIAALTGDVVYLTVSLTAQVTSPVVIDWTTSNGTALSGSDYVAASGQVTIPTTQRWVKIPVMTLGDIRTEPDENFTVSISTSSPLVQVSDGVGSITLLTDDTASAR